MPSFPKLANADRSLLELAAVALLLFPAIMFFTTLRPALKESEQLRREHRAALLSLKQTSDTRPRSVPHQTRAVHPHQLVCALRKTHAAVLRNLRQLRQRFALLFAGVRQGCVKATDLVRH